MRTEKSRAEEPRRRSRGGGVVVEGEPERLVRRVRGENREIEGGGAEEEASSSRERLVREKRTRGRRTGEAEENSRERRTELELGFVN